MGKGKERIIEIRRGRQKLLNCKNIGMAALILTLTFSGFCFYVRHFYNNNKSHFSVYI